MKKISIIAILLVAVLLSLGTMVFATEGTNTIVQNTTQTNNEESQIIENRNKMQIEIEEFTKKYGSESYGITAFILNTVRIYSIPLCFLGIVVGALYQYVLGTRRLDMRHKGFAVIVAAITILVICQVLPLIFAIVVKGWR